ncbi:Flagellar biosynthesis protein FliR [Rhodovulum sp. PH10]|uniref:flagellar biosynthetic protein FliR n=1 Tax=Rhodovulum sp. PH10 TaxID=1187851 RepID=UPI00027C1F63|nr:flagellar biosynthetic protein FliR [Rhodovulum sp. PH10]EJW09379.1 Flagellar biosynthesis protein FliR [Rhodovulum sp. PH10]
MRIDVSFLPALAAAFLLIFARTGTMVMLLPGIGERSVPARFRLAIALGLTVVVFPLHRGDYVLDTTSFGPVLAMLGGEMMIGFLLGMTARLTLSALQVTGSIVAQQLGFGFVTTVDPTQGQQGVIVANFLTLLGVVLIFATDLHHLVIAALGDSYTIFKPGEFPATGDMAALIVRMVGGAFGLGVQISAPFLVFGLLFNVGLGILSRLMPQMQVFFVAMPLSIVGGLLVFVVVIAAMMATFLGYFESVMHALAPAT